MRRSSRCTACACRSAAPDHAPAMRLLRAKIDPEDSFQRIGLTLRTIFGHPALRCAECHTEHVGRQGQMQNPRWPARPRRARRVLLVHAVRAGLELDVASHRCFCQVSNPIRSVALLIGRAAAATLGLDPVRLRSAHLCRLTLALTELVRGCGEPGAGVSNLVAAASACDAGRARQVAAGCASPFPLRRRAA